MRKTLYLNQHINVKSVHFVGYYYIGNLNYISYLVALKER
jgi:hypothetical protein